MRSHHFAASKEATTVAGKLPSSDCIAVPPVPSAGASTARWGLASSGSWGA